MQPCLRSVRTVIDPDSPWPAWRQLADHLRGRIASGELAPGDRLPSEETLQQEWGIARNTVRKAIATLRADGLVDVDPPRPTRVRARPEEQTVKVNAGTVRSRMPTPDERREHGIPEGVPVLVVEDAKGRAHVYPADRTALRISPSGAR